MDVDYNFSRFVGLSFFLIHIKKLTGFCLQIQNRFVARMYKRRVSWFVGFYSNVDAILSHSGIKLLLPGPWLRMLHYIARHVFFVAVEQRHFVSAACLHNAHLYLLNRQTVLSCWVNNHLILFNIYTFIYLVFFEFMGKDIRTYIIINILWKLCYHV